MTAHEETRQRQEQISESIARLTPHISPSGVPDYYNGQPAFTVAIRDNYGVRQTGLGFSTYTSVIEYLYYEHPLAPDQEGVVTGFGNPSFIIRFADAETCSTGITAHSERDSHGMIPHYGR